MTRLLEQTTRPVRYLHISDLHFSGTDDEWDSSKVLQPFLAACRDRSSQAERPDLVFFTGDLGSRGSPQDYVLAESFLDELLGALGLSKDTLWLVPGNHDVNRQRGLLLRRTLGRAAEADEIFFGQMSLRGPYLEKFSAYAAFLRRYFPDRALAMEDVVHAPSVLEVGGVRVGIAPFNSAWFCQDDADLGKLWIGSRLVRERHEALQNEDPDVTIALMHHPIHYLHEDDSAGAWLQQQFDLILRGHLHLADVARTESNTSAVLEVATGALYQGSYQPCRALFGEFDSAARTLRLEPYCFVDSPAARTWVLDTSVFPGSSENGYVGDFELGGQLVAGAARRRMARVARVPAFPFDSWRHCVDPYWLPTVVDWFESAYRANPAPVMTLVVDHCVEVVTATLGQRNFEASIRNLARALRVIVVDTGSPEASHHALLLDLFSAGISAPVSHLFMLPAVDLAGLLENRAYVELLAATRALAAGDLQRAEELAREVGVDCCVAGFVIGQALRKQERNLEAEVLLQEVGRTASTGPTGRRACNASPTLQCICNPHLLAAELQRALAVVARRLKRREEAERRFAAATTAARAAVDERGTEVTDALGTSELKVGFDVDPMKVVADVNFSHGYYWFEADQYERASELFDASIEAVELSGVEWDAPFTRKGLIQMLNGEIEAAMATLARARELCRRTSLQGNREALLSIALCSVAMEVAKDKVASGEIKLDSAADLDRALASTPPMSRGALLCHRSDAEKLRTVASPEAAGQLELFISTLGRAIGGTG